MKLRIRKKKKGEDDPRRMMSLAKTVGKAVYVSLFFHMYTHRRHFVFSIMCSFFFYMEK